MFTTVTVRNQLKYAHVGIALHCVHVLASTKHAVTIVFSTHKESIYTLKYGHGKTEGKTHTVTDTHTRSLSHTCVNHSSPGRVSNVGHQEVIEHSPSIVSAEHVNPIVPDHDGVLATARANKFLTARHLFPEMERLGGRKVECQIGFCRHADTRHVRGASARGRLRHTVGLAGLLRLKKWLFASVELRALGAGEGTEALQVG